MSHDTPTTPASPDVYLDHERLHAYQAALAFDHLACTLLRRLPRGCTGLADQLARASAGAVLSIAESAGRRGADRAYHARIARGSALECGAVLDLLANRRALDPARLAEAKAVLARVNAMLIAYERAARSP
jgi:four helix bundle protein